MSHSVHDIIHATKGNGFRRRGGSGASLSGNLTTLNWLRNASVNFVKRDLSNCCTKHLDIVNKMAEEAGYKLKLGKRK